MAHSMKVVFKADVRGIAQAGDLKTVSPGYARNYLFPRKLAFPANDAALRQWETERQATLAKATRLREDAQSIAQRIEAAVCTIPAKAGTEGHLFGSVGKTEIAAALAKEGLPIDKRSILMPQPIKLLGTTTVTVRLNAGVQAQLKVNVVPETA
jgi:large subunit ribosomal protein L9